MTPLVDKSLGTLVDDLSPAKDFISNGTDSSRGQSFVSTSIGSPLSTVDELKSSSHILQKFEEILNIYVATGHRSDATPPISHSKSSTDKQPLCIPSVYPLQSTVADMADSVLTTPLIRTVASSDVLTDADEAKSRHGSSSSGDWGRSRFRSCLEEQRSLTADLISRFEASQSDTYKEYRNWKESKWGEDALDQVEFEEDDINLELTIPTFFSLPMIQVPTLGESLRNVHERIVGYMLTISDLFIEADYYLQHPRELWQSITNAAQLLCPSPPKSLRNVMWNLISSTDTEPGTETELRRSQTLIAEFGMELEPSMEVNSEDHLMTERRESSRVPRDDLHEMERSENIMDSREESRNPVPLRALVLQRGLWILRTVALLLSLGLTILGLILMRLYDLAVSSKRLFAFFDSADQTFWSSAATWLPSMGEENSYPSMKAKSGVSPHHLMDGKSTWVGSFYPSSSPNSSEGLRKRSSAPLTFSGPSATPVHKFSQTPSLLSTDLLHHIFEAKLS